MSKRIVLVILLAVVASAITAGAVVVVGQGGGAGEGEYGTLYIDVGPLTGNTADGYGTIDTCIGDLTVGTPFDIDIIIDGANDLAGPYWVLYYNKDVLKVTASNWSSWKMGDGGLNFTDGVPDTDGAFSCTYIQASGVNGAGVLLRMTLEPIADGSSDLKLCTAEGDCPNAADSSGSDHPYPQVLVDDPAGEVRAVVGSACPPGEEGAGVPAPVPCPTPAASPEARPYVETKIPPIKALKPGEVEVPSGTPVAGLALPLDYGRFRIIPHGVPDYIPDPPLQAGRITARVDVRESNSLEGFREHDLFVDPPYIPTGWELGEAHAETVIWDDGSRQDTKFALVYYQPEYTEIRIVRFLIAPEGQVELLAPPPGPHNALILNEIRGVPVVFVYGGSLEVHFVVGNVVTRVEGVAIQFDELIKIADALIAETDEPTAAVPAVDSSPAPAVTPEPSPEPSPPPTAPPTSPEPTATPHPQSTPGAPGCDKPGPTPPPNARYIPPSELWPVVDYTEDGWPIVADELIVKFKESVPEEEREAILSQVGARSKDIYEYSDIRIVKVDPAQREQILEELSSNENIKIVEVNPIAKPDTSQ